VSKFEKLIEKVLQRRQVSYDEAEKILLPYQLRDLRKVVLDHDYEL